MRTFYASIALFSAAGGVLVGCSAPSGSSAGSTGSGGNDCHEILVAKEPCNGCLQQRCCAELSACYTSPECIYCSSIDSTPTACHEEPQKSIVLSLLQCFQSRCGDSCSDTMSYDGGPCMDMEPDGGVTFGDCAAPKTSVVRGTIYGKPFDQTFSGIVVGIAQGTASSLAVSLPDTGNGSGELRLDWTKWLYDGIPASVTGTFQIPGETVAHLVDAPGSLLWNKCGTNTFGFRLVLRGGDQISGCASE